MGRIQASLDLKFNRGRLKLSAICKCYLQIAVAFGLMRATWRFSMIEREMKEILLKRAKEYPVVTITGPRQSGKTTLVRNAFPKH